MKKLILMVILVFMILPQCNVDDIKPEHQTTTTTENARRRSNQSPVANAGSDISITLPIDSVTLNGSKSYDPDGSLVAVSWKLNSGTGTYTIVTPTSLVTVVDNLVEGAYTFRLTVTDNRGSIRYDDVNVVVIKPLPPPPPPDTVGVEYYFNKDFQNAYVYYKTSLNTAYIGNWGLETVPLVNNVQLNNTEPKEYAFQQIVADPTNTNRNVLYAQVIDDNPTISSVARAQMSIRFNSDVNLPIYHTSHRMYLHPDVQYFTNYSSSITWFTIVEIWNQYVSTWGGSTSGSARWGLSIFKDSGAGQSLYWRLKADYMQPETMHDVRMWTYYNRTVPIPTGKWFTLDIYMKRGDNADGRMTITLTPDGEQSQIMFDVANSTQYPGHPEIPLSSWQPFKLYLNDTYLDWMRLNNKKIAAYYNDFKWYVN
jgi:hypothetical protein